MKKLAYKMVKEILKSKYTWIDNISFEEFSTVSNRMMLVITVVINPDKFANEYDASLVFPTKETFSHPHYSFSMRIRDSYKIVDEMKKDVFFVNEFMQSKIIPNDVVIKLQLK